MEAEEEETGTPRAGFERKDLSQEEPSFTKSFALGLSVGDLSWAKYSPVCRRSCCVEGGAVMLWRRSNSTEGASLLKEKRVEPFLECRGRRRGERPAAIRSSPPTSAFFRWRPWGIITSTANELQQTFEVRPGQGDDSICL